MNVELRHLRAFVAVAEARNFTRAAEELHISQPSLSYTISQLEAQLGVQLLSRTTRHTAITAAGEAFLTEAKAVLARHEQALHTAKRLAAGHLGRLRIGYLIGAAVDYVPAILRAFERTYPQVEVELTEFDFAAPDCGLDIGTTDVAIARPPLNVDGVQTHTLLTEARYACLPDDHRLTGQDAVPVSALAEEPIVAAPGTGPWRDSWISGWHSHVAAEAATFEAEMQAVALGKGISIVPASAARLYARPGVCFVPINDADDCEVCVAHTEEAPPSAANFARLAQHVVQGVDDARRSATSTA